MRVLDWAKSKLSGGPSLEDLNKIPLMNEKWLLAEFEFPFPDSLFFQLSKVSSKENPTREEVIIGFVLPKLGELGRIKRLACKVNEKTNPPTVLLRFPDRSGGDEELEGKIIYKDGKANEDEYRFTPIEDIKYREDFHAIEYTLLTMFGLEKLQTRDMVEFYFEGLNGHQELTEKEIRKKRLMVERTDNISYFNYPLEKRVELFSEHEEAEKWLSKNLFGESLKQSIEFIMEKEGTFKFSEIYCSEVEKLLKKYDISLLGRSGRA